MQYEKCIKILLVESDEECQIDFRDKIEKNDLFRLVKIVNGAKEALETLINDLPDVIITELALRQGEGISLIRKIREAEKVLPVRPYIVVITHNTSDAVMNMLNDKYADFIFSKDIDDFGANLVLEHLDVMKGYLNCNKTTPRKSGDMVAITVISASERKQKLQEYIEQNIVNKLCISANLLGRRYIIDALVIGVEYNGKEAMKHSKFIYPVLKKMHKNSIENINRAINIAIEHAWDDTDEETLQKVYSAYVNPQRGKPTVGEFIKYFVDDLKRKGFGDI